MNIRSLSFSWEYLVPIIFLISLASIGQLSLISELQAADTLLPQTCLNNTENEGQCKDCCDCISNDADAMKSCRDSCATQDYSQNSDFIAVNALSQLGANGDYFSFVETGSEQACKLACDSSATLACGDKRYCRDACNSAYSGDEFFPVTDNGESSASAPTNVMDIEQTLSDQAQMLTIAFDGLAFMTGDMCSDTFLPPGKVADFSGFQYFRDNDPTGLGHNTDFVTIIAFNILNLLDESQIAMLVDLADSQIAMINQYGYMRFPLIKAFRRLMDDDLPEGATGLSKSAIMSYSAELYRLDGEISYDRAKTLGAVIRSLTTGQKTILQGLIALNGIGNWDSNVSDPLQQLYPQLDREKHVAVMTYASEMYSWYAGSVEADTYFCPERQGTYFGSFYMKDMPAMGNAGFTIPDNLTADMGDSFLAVLNDTQSSLVTNLVDIQKTALYGIVDARTDISTLLRQFMLQDSVDEATVLALAEKYGELDGEIIYNYASNFSSAGQSLDDSQQAQLVAIREEWNSIACQGAFLYSENIEMPEIINTDFLFGIGDSSVTTTETESPVEDNAQLITLVDGLQFAEGPAADKSGNLYFSDITANRIYHWRSDTGAIVFKENSGPSNGLFITTSGELLAADSGNQRIVTINDSTSVTLLADNYNGLAFNEPNDLWATVNGDIYFSDPAYNTGLSQDGEHVYYLSRQDNKVTRVVDDMVRPNGIVGTADGNSLYITDHGAQATYRYAVNNDGSLSDKTVFAAVGGDGMTIDSQGNLYIAEQDVLVYNSLGTLLETISMPEQPTNLTFGGLDGKTLFITTKTAVYSLAMNISGNVNPVVKFAAKAEPVPDIKVNGSDSSINIAANSTVSITVNLDVGDYTGQKADCWIWADTPFGRYSYVYPQGWRSGLYPVMQLPLADIITPYEVLGNSTLPVGEYQLHFAVDNNVDGEPDQTWSDSIFFQVD